MSDQIFTCHKSAEVHPIACAGFIERGADHNKTVRLAYMFDKLKAMDRTGGYALYEDYRAMAIANGVPEDHSALKIGRAHAELQSLMRISYAVFCLKKKK